jgi:PAS domain S-box-containing protein
MNIDNSPPVRPVGNRASSASFESEPDVKPANSDEAAASGSVGPDDHFLLHLEGESEDAGNEEHAGSETTVFGGGCHVAINDADAFQEGGLLGRFRLQKAIARGGMGMIIEARDLELDREVAIKLLHKQHVDQAHIHQQFTNEARITGRLQHPGVVPIYATGTSLDQRPYFAMKLVRGKTLAELLAARTSPLVDLPRFLNIFEQVCQTLSYTHSCGVIHLDIKPANIMVGAFGEVHLMDWGLARASTELRVPSHVARRQEPLDFSSGPLEEPPAIASHDLEVTVPAGAVWGTPAYMSPEQASGHCSDVRSDVFGLGGMLCEILTGHPPYHGANFQSVCLKAGRADLSDAFDRLLDSDADEVLVRLAVKCLSPDPEDRPADAGIVASELTLYLESLLQRAGNDLERFFELSLDLFCIAGLDGYLRRVNSNFPRVLGHSEKDLLSRPFLDFVHPEDREQTIKVMSQLMRGDPVVQFQNRYRTVENTWRRFEWTAKSIPEDGVIFAVARDVTERMG